MIGADDGIDLGRGSGGWVSIRDIVDRITRLDVRLGAEVVARSADVRSVGEVARGAEHAIGILATQVGEQIRGITVAHGQVVGQIRESITSLGTHLAARHAETRALETLYRTLDQVIGTVRERIGAIDVLEARLDRLERELGALSARLDERSVSTLHAIDVLRAATVEQQAEIDELRERIGAA